MAHGRDFCKKSSSDQYLNATCIKSLVDFGESAFEEAAKEGLEEELEFEEPADDSAVKHAVINLPMTLEIKTSQGDTTTLGKLASGKKAVLLDFWASWCRN